MVSLMEIMSVRSKIERKIQEKLEEITECEQRIAKHRAYIEGLQDALKLHPKENEPSVDSSYSLRPGSEMARVQDLIAKADQPLHISDILKGLQKEDTAKNRASVSGSLSNYARQGKVFTKPSPNTFGLIPKPDGILKFDGKAIGL
jgi:Mg2+ and Co2+ transporter CorA